ncbi:gamma carbonic anhydrase family protein [Mycobacterium tuberculosis]|uniref:gamma carbonic anhydrase family protein n=1 Tax=Mycobacterium tuberculosis TaxID=1773 RepID=UPI003F8AE2B2
MIDTLEPVLASHKLLVHEAVMHVTGRHGLYVAERVTVGHGAILHGCRIESDCLIAMGAVVLDHAVIGHGSIVAAGAVVSPGKEIPPYSLVMGVPGKIVRQLSEDDRGQIERMSPAGMDCTLQNE